MPVEAPALPWAATAEHADGSVQPGGLAADLTLWFG
jgi:hypothetical protein